MISLIIEFITTWWQYLIIPFIAGIVGWITNVIAIKMTFYPIEYFGIFPFGWQGIIPSKARVMAGKSVDLLTTSLISVEERMNQIDAEEIAAQLQPVLEQMSIEIINEAMQKNMPIHWAAMGKRFRQKIYDNTIAEMPHAVEAMINEIKANIDDLLDIKKMVVETLVNNKALLNEMFLRCGREEFKFIERSGLYFGFLFGIVQMMVVIFYNPWWMLPVGGLLVGYLTNWLALKLIFEPKEPKRILWFTVQGLFIKRQPEVSEEYAQLVSRHIITSPKLYRAIIQGAGTDKLIDITYDQISDSVDKAVGINRSLIELTAGTKRYQAIKEIAFRRVREVLPGKIKLTFRYTERALDIENTIRDRMRSLPPDEFEGVLRPAYQQDEWKLILTGAILGGLAGLAQMSFIFAL